MSLNIRFYKENKMVYQIDLQMSYERLMKQLDEGKLVFYNTSTHGTEIINLNQFDFIRFSGDIEFNWSKLDGDAKE